MARRRSLLSTYTTSFTELKELNINSFKGIAKDVGTYNTKQITKVIVENKSMKVLREKLTRGIKHNYELKDKKENIKTNREDTLKITEIVTPNSIKLIE